MTQKQLTLFKREDRPFGGTFFMKRKGRGRRPLTTKKSMHLVLRSSKAVAEWSFRRAENSRKIREILSRFSNKFGVRILSLANVGNHLHLHIQLTNRFTYPGFIRSITSAIAMAVTRVSRWRPGRSGPLRFWDRRPFTRIIQGYSDRLGIEDYMRINQLEGGGFGRSVARMLLPYQRFRGKIGSRL